MNIIKKKVIKYSDIVKIYDSGGRGNVMVILHKVANKNKKITFTSPNLEDYDKLKFFLEEKGITVDR